MGLMLSEKHPYKKKKKKKQDEFRIIEIECSFSALIEAE